MVLNSIFLPPHPEQPHIVLPKKKQASQRKLALANILLREVAFISLPNFAVAFGVLLTIDMTEGLDACILWDLFHSAEHNPFGRA